MRGYLAILSSHFRSMLQYRAAAVAGVITQLFFGGVRVMIYDGFYGSGAGPQPMTAGDVVTYIWLGQGLLLLTILGTDSDVASMIRTGNVAYEMTRPLDLYNLWFSRALGGRLASILLRATPIFIIAGLFFGLPMPASALALGLFVLSLCGAFLLAASIIVLLTIMLLWTISGDGISKLVPVLIFFFSGIVIPIPLFPDWMQGFLALFPVRGLIDTPLRIYMQHLHGSGAATAIAHQFVWVLVLVACGRALLARGIRRLVVQGG